MTKRPSLCPTCHRCPFGHRAVSGRSGRLNLLEMGAFLPLRATTVPTIGGKNSSRASTSHRRCSPDKTAAPTVSALSP
jgi:hypothetical protein